MTLSVQQIGSTHDRCVIGSWTRHPQNHRGRWRSLTESPTARRLRDDGAHQPGIVNELVGTSLNEIGVELLARRVGRPATDRKKGRLQ